MPTSRNVAVVPTRSYVGRSAIAKEPNPISRTEIRNADFQPITSPMCPKMIIPIGRTPYPTASTANAESVAASLSPSGKSRESGELARAGATVTGKLPQTGAFPRAGLGAAGEALTGPTAGAITYGLTRDPALSAGVGLLSAMSPAVRSVATASRPGQAYLGNQLVQGSTPVEQSLLPLLPALNATK